jgi:hypothetical protein
MIKKELFTNENTELKNYGAIYKDQDKYTISNKQLPDKQLIAEAFFHKSLFEIG